MPQPRSHSEASPDIEIMIDAAPINVQNLLNFVSHPDCGAQLVFLGTTRRTTGDQITTLLDYDAYRPMADRELEKIAQEAFLRWALFRVAIHHRLGSVAVEEASVAVAASSPHRTPVMEAIPWMMEQLKKTVPIWKRETSANGSTSWIHP